MVNRSSRITVVLLEVRQRGDDVAHRVGVAAGLDHLGHAGGADRVAQLHRREVAGLVVEPGPHGGVDAEVGVAHQRLAVGQLGGAGTLDQLGVAGLDQAGGPLPQHHLTVRQISHGVNLATPTGRCRDGRRRVGLPGPPGPAGRAPGMAPGGSWPRICSSWLRAAICWANSVAWMPWNSPSSQPTSWAWAMRSSASLGSLPSPNGMATRSSSSRRSGDRAAPSSWIEVS